MGNYTCQVCRFRHPRGLTCAEARARAEAAHPETVPCELCSKPTQMLGTKRCDPCWELERRIRHDPELARRILEGLE
jgi:hypothetical protein